jgi:hypothetical protein
MAPPDLDVQAPGRRRESLAADRGHLLDAVTLDTGPPALAARLACGGGGEGHDAGPHRVAS